MKKSDWIILIATLSYSCLFYQQLAGINYFIFSVLLVTLLAINSFQVLKKTTWYLYAGLSIATSFFIMWHNSNLAIWANISSLLLLSANSINTHSSVLLNGFYSIYSIAGSYVFLIINLVKRNQTKDSDVETKGSSKKGVNFLIGITVFIIVLIFFFLYKSANPLFDKYTEKINLDFISGTWILFSTAGFFMVYGFFKHQRIQGLDHCESKLPISLVNTGTPLKSFERSGGIVLFILLNLMLVFINILDVVYLYVLNKLPEGISHTQFVHNGVGMLILSIILGIAIILYLFRNAMNFEVKNKIVKLLVSIWILQNGMMIFSTAVRNYIYVDEFNLTYKRIGVFVYLSLSIVGLFLTLYKIHYKKSNWFLIRRNAFAWFLFLCFASFINWDQVICSFNVQRKMNKLAYLDKKYLLSLSDESIPYLQQLKNKKGFETDSAYKDEYRKGSELSLFSSRENYENTNIKNASETDNKTYDFLKKVNSYSNWQSWNHRNSKLMDMLVLLNKQNTIESLTLHGQELDSVQLLNVFNNAKYVDLGNCQGKKFQFLKNYRQLNSLDLKGNQIKYINEVPGSSTLKQLSLDYNDITNLSGIERFPSIEILSLSNSSLTQLKDVAKCQSLKKITLNSCTHLKDLRGLEKLPQLETLDLNEANSFDYFPTLNALKKLSLANSVTQLLDNIPLLINLESLQLSSSNGVQLEQLLIFDKQTRLYTSRFPKLKKLFAYSSSIDNWTALKYYTQLEVLQLNNNKITDNLFMENYTNMVELSLAGNHLNNLSFNANHINLQRLNLSGNEYLDDYSSLKKLSNLNYLDVSKSRFIDLKLLTCSTTLKELNIMNTRVNSIEALLKFKQLNCLRISSLNEKDIVTLSKLKYLKEVYLSSEQYTEEGLKQLSRQLPNIKFHLI